jgi:glycosyltransferase involved in cell wall biosynthesis
LGIRVAHFIQRYPPALGGSEAYFARLGRYLAAAGEQVTVFTTAALALEAFWSKRGRCLQAGTTTEDGVRIRRYSLCRWPGRRYVLKALSLVPHRLWQCLTMPCNPIALKMWRDCGRGTDRFDLVHASAFPYAFPIVCGLRLARRLRVPFVLTPFLHLGDPDDPDDPIRRSYTSPALLALIRAADRVFVQTSGEADALKRLGIPAEKVVLQGLGVEPSECTGGDRARARQSWRVREDEVVVGHLANNSREKGTVDLLQAAQLLWQRGVPARIVLAGPEMPNFRAFFKNFTSDLAAGSSPPVLRLGVLDDSQKRDFFAGLDVFALPSRSDSFGLVLLEAWANGLPNIAYRAGGIADVIRHEGDGLLAPCGKIEALADGLTRLIRDADLRRRLGDAGRQRLPREFHWHDKLALVRRVYRQVVEEMKNEERKMKNEK